MKLTKTIKLIGVVGLALQLHAASITTGGSAVTLDSTGQTIGQFQTSPWTITLDYGGGAVQTLQAFEFDLRDSGIALGVSFPVEILTVQEAASQGVFSQLGDSLLNYELEVALSTEAPALSVQEVGWDVMEPNAFPVTTTMAFDLAFAYSELPVLDWNDWRIVQGIEGDTSIPSMVIETKQGWVGGDPVNTPEPASCILLGLSLVGIGWKRWTKATK